MNEKALVPKLQFNGFDKSWKSSIGKNIFELLGGGSFKSKDSVKEGILWLKIANVGINEIKNNDLSYLPMDFQNTFKKYLLKKGDVILALTRPILDHKLKIAIINDEFDNSLLNQRVGKITSLNNVDIKFIYYYLQLPHSIHYLESKISGSDPPNLSNNDLLNMPINIPSFNEQEKISQFISLIDKKIELLRTKHKNYLDFKKYLIQQIFTQKLRFDFTQDWEITKLGDITKINTGNKDVKDKKDDGKYPFFVRSEKVERIDSYSYDGEAILIPGDGKIGEVYHYINGKFDYHQRVYKISDFNTKVYGKYIYYYLEKNFLRQAMKNTAKATVDSLRMDTLTKMPIELPTIEEQIKIADILSISDNKIKLIKNDINIVKNFKKGLLQQMFV